MKSKHAWKTEKGEEKELLVDGDFMYYLDNDEDESKQDRLCAVIVDYMEPTGRILVLPEKIAGYNVSPVMLERSFKFPKEVEYIIIGQEVFVYPNCFLRCDSIKKVVAIYDSVIDTEEDIPYGVKRGETLDFYRCKDIPITDSLAPYYNELHYMVEHGIAMRMMRHLQAEDDVEGLEYLLSTKMSIGDIYFNAIVNDDLECILKLEKMSFPNYSEIATSKNEFLRNIGKELKHFHSDKIWRYYVSGQHQIVERTGA